MLVINELIYLRIELSLINNAGCSASLFNSASGQQVITLGGSLTLEMCATYANSFSPPLRFFGITYNNGSGIFECDGFSAITVSVAFESTNCNLQCPRNLNQTCGSYSTPNFYFFTFEKERVRLRLQKD
jgi:hypothetical protein